LVNWSGHGLVDLAAYDAYFQGKLTDYELPKRTSSRRSKRSKAFLNPTLIILRGEKLAQLLPSKLHALRNDRFIG